MSSNGDEEEPMGGAVNAISNVANSISNIASSFTNAINSIKTALGGITDSFKKLFNVDELLKSVDSDNKNLTKVKDQADQAVKKAEGDFDNIFANVNKGIESVAGTVKEVQGTVDKVKNLGADLRKIFK